MIALWSGGVLLMAGMTVRDWIRARRLATVQAPGHILRIARRVKRSAGIAKMPDIWLSDRIESPALCGYLRPKIVLPRWLAADEHEDPVWVLRHEMTHLRHWDHVANAVRRIAQTLFFFHPVVWWAGRAWEEAAEFACDEALTQSPQEARAYAKQLYSLLVGMQQRRASAVSAGLYASRTQVGRRIEALLRRERPVRPANRMRRAFGSVIAIVVLVLGLGRLAGSDTSLIGGTEDHRHTFQTHIKERSLTYTIEISATGTIGFSENHESMTSMSDDAQLTYRVKTIRKEMSIVVSPGDGTTLELQYQVNGNEQPLDDTGRDWLSRAIKRLGRRDKS